MDDYSFAGVPGNLIFAFSSLRARMLVQGIFTAQSINSNCNQQ